MKLPFLIPLAAFLLCSCSTQSHDDDQSSVGPSAADKEHVVVAYVTSWSDVIPDPSLMSHINYSFGHVDKSFDGMHIDNTDRLRRIVALKEQNPELKVLVSVGGWESGNFSEMAADSTLRRAFAASCRKAVDEYGLDGIDIDWEYPTKDWAGISASPDDTRNFTLLMRDLRAALGDDKLLTIATIASGEYMDFADFIEDVDLVNIMAYDMGWPPYLHNGLFPSPNTKDMTSSKAVQLHLQAGVPKEKLVMGMPLYGKGHREVLDDPAVEIRWDSLAMVPYAVMCDTLALGFENVESITHKCQYILDQELRGGMYWEYNSEKGEHPLATRIHDMLRPKAAEQSSLRSQSKAQQS